MNTRRGVITAALIGLCLCVCVGFICSVLPPQMEALLAQEPVIGPPVTVPVSCGKSITG